MLIATHEMGFAREVADEVCFLHDGLILERGEPGADLHRARAAGDPALPAPAARGRAAARHLYGSMSCLQGGRLLVTLAHPRRIRPRSSC